LTFHQDIYREVASDPAKAASKVTSRLIDESPPPSKTSANTLIILKPNIVRPSPPPVTTDFRVIAGIIVALKNAGFNEIAVAEGSGTGNTLDNLEQLGYSSLGVRLIDLDSLPSSPVKVPGFEVWNTIYLPDILINAFIISVPVLKDHSMLGVTLGLKNMVGVLPSAHYSGYWTYKKSQIHKSNPHGCVSDLIKIIRPHWTIVDATVGMKDSHISGAHICPPVNIVFGSSNSLEADKYGTKILGHNWNDIEYLRKISEHW